MKIVVLDGYTLNPGDLSWSELEGLGECRVYERTSKAQVVERAAGAQVVLVNKVEMDRETMARLAELRYVGVLATGYNIVDVQAARERGIVVTNVPEYGTRSVAQMTMALLLELTQRVGEHARGVREGRWAKAADWSYWDGELVELAGLTMGIVGLGRIGRAVAELAKALGMEVAAHDATVKEGGPPYVRMVGLEELFRGSDVVSLHCPLTEETRGMINARRLGEMKRTALLINTARGALVNEEDLARALNEGRIAGAAVDVLGVEPPGEDHVLVKARNCIVTPHMAWGTRAARERLMRTAVENVRQWMNGGRRNQVT